MSPWQAHLLCLALVVLDWVARAWRIVWLIRGTGHRISFGDAFALNAYGDAASAVTPLRLGGEPARLAGMMASRVPAAAAFVAISYEVLAAWPVVIAAAGWLAWRFAPAWLELVGPSLGSALTASWPWVAAVTLVSVGLWLWVRRGASPATHLVRRPVRRIQVYWRRMPWWPLLASGPMTLVNLVCRTAILAVLASTLPSPPPLGPLLLGSFALLYSQLLLPTPSGVGAVEVGFLAGAAGNLGGEAGLLLAWRFYTAGAGVVLGAALVAHRYGWQAVRPLLRGRGFRGGGGEGAPSSPA